MEAGADEGLEAAGVLGAAGQEAAADEFEDEAVGAGQIAAPAGGMDWWMGLVIEFTFSGGREFYQYRKCVDIDKDWCINRDR